MAGKPHSEKPSAQLCMQVLKQHGVKHLVVSPGSRNAPLIIEALSEGYFELHSIVDERSAGFFALGMMQQLQSPVAVISTSGSALLNYAPAVAEAYYQKLPLVVISADRPEDKIDQGDGQTIRQRGALDNFTKACAHITDYKRSEVTVFRHAFRELSEALLTSKEKPRGPIHVNMAFREPLYNQVNEPYYNGLQPIQLSGKANSGASQDEMGLEQAWNTSRKKMILLGMGIEGEVTRKQLENLVKNDKCVVLSETTSNLYSPYTFPCIDKLVVPIESQDGPGPFIPELLITFGNNIVSKKIKALLRKHRPLHHWHIGSEHQLLDTFESLTAQMDHIPEFMDSPLHGPDNADTSFYNRYKKLAAEAEVKHEQFIKKAPFSDLLVFNEIIRTLPENAVVHYGNSTPVRYSQLFNPKKQLYCFANRGTSGIDGSVSTAAGAARMLHPRPVFCVVGDASFFYDSNALFNTELPGNLRIILINNAGGGIFRIIDGPGKVQGFEKYIEASHNFNARGICDTFGVGYSDASGIGPFRKGLDMLINSKTEKAMVLEVFSPRKQNGVVLKKYFDTIKQ